MVNRVKSETEMIRTSRLPFGGKGGKLVVVRAFQSFILKLDMTVSPFFLTFLSKIVDTMAVLRDAHYVMESWTPVY